MSFLHCGPHDRAMQAELSRFCTTSTGGDILAPDDGGDIQMRLIFTAILALSVGAIGCSGAATSTTENALATTSTAAAHTNGAPATAASRADAAHPAAGVEARASAAVPEIREVTIPAGTSLPVVLETGVASDTSRVEDTVTGHLSRSITIDGMTALPEGSRV